VTIHTDSADDLFDADSRNVTFDSVGLDDIDRFAALMLHHLPAGIAVGLVGTLGAGKTRLVQGIAKAAQVGDVEVTSPTFTLLQTYPGQPTLHHLDAYRIEDEDEFLELGVDELFDDSQAWTLVEWADRVRAAMPVDTLWIRILIMGSADNRVIQVVSPNDAIDAAVRRARAIIETERGKGSE
tara:strand:+ start:289624 stop:290172 length:549 start_codon:yes stop_codon:yes gene_type:complete